MNVRALAIARSYRQLMASLRARADEMQITRETTDARGGLPSGYSGRLLSPNAIKNVGPISLDAFLSILRLKLVIVEDETAPILDLPKRIRPNPRSAARIMPTSVKHNRRSVRAADQSQKA